MHKHNQSFCRWFAPKEQLYIYNFIVIGQREWFLDVYGLFSHIKPTTSICNEISLVVSSENHPKVSESFIRFIRWFSHIATSPTIAQVILFMLVSIEARQRRPNQSDVAMESMQSGDLSNMGSWAPKSWFLQLFSPPSGHFKSDHRFFFHRSFLRLYHALPCFTH